MTAVLPATPPLPELNKPYPVTTHPTGLAAPCQHAKFLTIARA